MESKKVKISDIDFPERELRDPIDFEADKVNPNDMALLMDIEKNGVEDVFTVRQVEDGYEVMNGSRRLACLKHLIKTGKFPKDYSLTVQVKEMDETDALIRQVSGNANVRVTGNKDFINAIYTIISERRVGSLEELANMIGVSTNWLTKLLQTKSKLPDEAFDLVGSKGGIPITNAIRLGDFINKLEDEEKAEAIEKAKESSKDFNKFALEKEGELADRKSGKKKSFEDTINPKCRTKDELYKEFVRADNAYKKEASKENEIKLALWKWIFQVDDATIKEKKEEWDRKQEEKNKSKEQRKKERERKKLDELAQKHNVEIIEEKLDEEKK